MTLARFGTCGKAMECHSIIHAEVRRQSSQLSPERAVADDDYRVITAAGHKGSRTPQLLDTLAGNEFTSESNPQWLIS